VRDLALNDIRPGVYPPIIKDPDADGVTAAFWEAARQGRLACSRCRTCQTMVLPPQPRCFVCQGAAFEWLDLPGSGEIYAFTVVRHALRPEVQAAVPYVSAVIELDGTQGAGARLLANVIDVDPDEVKVGQRVTVVFDKVSDTLTVPRFRPC
jgi:uncharacterized OB-fold protein